MKTLSLGYIYVVQRPLAHLKNRSHLVRLSSQDIRIHRIHLLLFSSSSKQTFCLIYPVYKSKILLYTDSWPARERAIRNCAALRMSVLRAYRDGHDHGLLLLAHDCRLANIVTGFYNKLLSYFMLFTFGHDLQTCALRSSVSAQGVKGVGHNGDTGMCILSMKAKKTPLISY